MHTVLPLYHGMEWQPGQPVSEEDIAAWSEWENDFFNLEGAMDYQEKAKNTPKGKAKLKRKVGCPASVKIVRGAAHQHIIALLCLMLGIVLVQLVVGHDLGNKDFGVRSNPLRAHGRKQMSGSKSDSDDVPARLPPTVCLHVDEGSPGLAMLRYLLYNKKLRFQI